MVTPAFDKAPIDENKERGQSQQSKEMVCVEERVEQWYKSKPPVMNQVRGIEQKPEVDKNKMKVVELTIGRGKALARVVTPA